MQVNVLVFESPPEPFDENVVLTAPPAVHADGDLVVVEDLGKGVAGELAALIGIEDLRRAISIDRFF